MEAQKETITGSAVSTEVPDFFLGEQETVTGSTMKPELPTLFPGVQETVTGSTITPETPALFPEAIQELYLRISNGYKVRQFPVDFQAIV